MNQPALLLGGQAGRHRRRAAGILLRAPVLRGPSHVVNRGEHPILSPEEARRLPHARLEPDYIMRRISKASRARKSHILLDNHPDQ